MSDLTGDFVKRDGTHRETYRMTDVDTVREKVLALDAWLSDHPDDEERAATKVTGEILVGLDALVAERDEARRQLVEEESRWQAAYTERTVERDEARRERDEWHDAWHQAALLHEAAEAERDEARREQHRAEEAARVATALMEGAQDACGDLRARAEAAEADRDRYAAALERQHDRAGSIPDHIAAKLRYVSDQWVADTVDVAAELRAELEYVRRFLTDATEDARAALEDGT